MKINILNLRRNYNLVSLERGFYSKKRVESIRLNNYMVQLTMNIEKSMYLNYLPTVRHSNLKSSAQEKRVMHIKSRISILFSEKYFLF